MSMNFIQIFEYDSATEEHCLEVVKSYKVAAHDAAEKAGRVLLDVTHENPKIPLGWSFTPKNKNDK